MEKFTAIFGYMTKNYTVNRIFLHRRSQKLTFKTALSSNKLRILLTNKYSPKKLGIFKMSITINDVDYRVTLNGKKRFKLQANQEIYTDEITIPESNYDKITITTKFSLFAKGYSAADFNSTLTAKVDHFGFLNRKVNLGLRTRAINKPHLQIVLLVKQVEVYAENAKTITWLGDSLTNHSHYTQALQNDLIKQHLPITILNAGQSGNRLLRDGKLLLKTVFGISTLKRIEDDVFKYNQPDAVVIAVGINDLIHPATSVPADELPQTYEMIDGYLELLKVIKNNNAKAVIATITPFNGYKDNVLPEAEARRQEINLWIRGQKDFDLVIDIDAIVRDKVDPSWLAPIFRSDDNLHFQEEGGQIIADNIDVDSLISLIK